MVAKIEEARPVYRHIVVKRKGFINQVAPVAQLREAHRQMQEVEDGVRKPEDVDPNLQHLIKRDHLRKTMKKVYGDQYDYAGSTPRNQGGAIVVATLNKVKIPGGTEPLPRSATFWTQSAPYRDMSPQDAFLEGALKLQQRFQAFSDNKIANLPDHLRRGVTLVTVAYTPIVAYALDPLKDEKGFEVGMEFHQVTRFGRVEVDDFEVYAEDGEYPIKPPNDAYMMALTKSASELGELPGFLSDEERQQIKVEAEANRAKRADLPPLERSVPIEITTPGPRDESREDVTPPPPPPPKAEPPPSAPKKLKRFQKLEFD